jgi:transposase
MGQQTRNESLFYCFRLKEQIPDDHLLRLIDRYIDLSFVRERLKRFYSWTGRPSIDPEVLLRLLLVGYLYGITSERRLLEEVRMHLAYRWFTRLAQKETNEGRSGRFLTGAAEKNRPHRTSVLLSQRSERCTVYRFRPGPLSHFPPSTASSPSVPACGRRLKSSAAPIAHRLCPRLHRVTGPKEKSDGGGVGAPGPGWSNRIVGPS